NNNKLTVGASEQVWSYELVHLIGWTSDDKISEHSPLPNSLQQPGHTPLVSNGSPTESSTSSI
ncbi:hypothetical protein NDU88_009830, partial [Pleurodeles waltl]